MLPTCVALPMLDHADHSAADPVPRRNVSLRAACRNIPSHAFQPVGRKLLYIAAALGGASRRIWQRFVRHPSIVQPFLCQQICRAGLLRGVEIADLDPPPADANASAVSRNARNELDTHRPARITTSRCHPIFRVDNLGNVTQVINTVVGGVAVNVIYNLSWLIPVYVAPRESMRQVLDSIDAYQGADVRCCSSSNGAGRRSWRGTNAPHKYSGIGVVMEKFAQSLRCGKIFGSHIASQVGCVVRASAALARCRGSFILSSNVSVAG